MHLIDICSLSELIIYYVSTFHVCMYLYILGNSLTFLHQSLLVWTLIVLIDLCIVAMTIYVGLKILSETSTFATLGLHYHLLKLFYAGTVITGVSLVSSFHKVNSHCVPQMMMV